MMQRWRLTLLIPLLLALSALGSGTAFFLIVERDAERQIEREAANDLRVLMTHLQNVLGTQLYLGNSEDAKLSLSVSAIHPGIEAILLADGAGRVVMASRFGWEGEPLDPSMGPLPEALAAQAKEGGNRLLFDAHEPLLRAYFPVKMPPGVYPDGVGMLYAQYRFSDCLQEARTRALLISLQVSGVLLLLAMLTSWLLYRRVTLRVAQIVRATRQVAAGELAPPLAMPGSDELAQIGHAIDRMAAERRVVEENLLRSEGRLRLLFNNVSEAIVLHRPLDGRGPFGEVLEINQVGCLWLAAARDELLGQPLEPFLALNAAIPLDWHSTGESSLRAEGELFSPQGKMSVDAQIHRIVVGNEVLLLTVLRDIGERKRFESIFRQVVQTTKDGYWTARLQDGCLTEVNDAYCRMSGFSREELLSMAIPQLDADDDPAKMRQRMGAIIEQGGGIFESRHRRKDGSLFEVEVSTSFIPQQEAFAIFVRDISERKQNERERQLSEARLKEAQRIAKVGSWEFDPHNNLLLWSDEIYSIFEIEKERFGASYEAFLDRIHPEDREAVNRAYLSSLQDRSHYEMTHRLLLGDGRIKYVVETGESDYDESGIPVRSVGTVQDISERRRVELALEESERQLRTLVDSAPIPMLVASGAESRVQHLNRTFLQVIGYGLDEIPDVAHWWLLACPDPVYRQQLQRIWAEAVAGASAGAGSVPPVEARITCKDGVERTFEVFLNSFGERSLVIFVDISQQRRAQSIVEEARGAAEAANRAKSEFLANMSHEIRTPMNAVIGLSHLALGQPMSPLLRDYLEKINHSAKGLLSIINDILDFSKIEAGRLEIEQLDFSLTEVLDNLVSLFSLRAEEKGIELLFDIDHDIPERLHGDSQRLTQVLANLLGNGIKFTSQGSVLLRIALSQMETGSCRLRFEVIDSGIGLSPEQLTRLFQPFTQADGSITRRFGGTGLGLTISQRLVSAMGGDIEVESRLGGGSCFGFTLAFGISSETLPSPSLQPMRLLLLDSHAQASALTARLLRNWGFLVEECSSAESVLAAMANRSEPETAVEVAVLDCSSNGQATGVLLGQMGQQRMLDRLPDLPVILLCPSRARVPDFARLPGIRLLGLLDKPFTPSHLYDLLNRLQGRATASAEVDLDHRHLLRGRRLLLAEDNEINTLVARGLLEGMGAQVVAVANGAEAVAALDVSAFDGVLMDVQMSMLDGLAATRRLRDDPRFTALPIIAMTAAAGSEDRQACLLAGMNDHLAKPLQPAEVVAVLRRWLAQLPEEVVSGRTADEEAPFLLPGFEVAEALQRLRGNLRLYDMLLRQLLADLEQLSQQLQQSEGKRLQSLLHRLRGMAGNLGGREIATLAGSLESALAMEQAVDLSPLLEAMARAMAVIAEHLLRDSQPERQMALAEECLDCDSQRMSRLFGELRMLLQGNDFVPPELIEQIGQGIGCVAGRGRMDELRRLLENFEYGRALILLDGFTCAREGGIES